LGPAKFPVRVVTVSPGKRHMRQLLSRDRQDGRLWQSKKRKTKAETATKRWLLAGGKTVSRRGQVVLLGSSSPCWQGKTKEVWKRLLKKGGGLEEACLVSYKFGVRKNCHADLQFPKTKREGGGGINPPKYLEGLYR